MKRLFLTLAVGCAITMIDIGGSLAFLPGGCVVKEPREGAPPLLAYSSFGNRTTGELAEIAESRSFDPTDWNNSFIASPVLLGVPGQYPPPFSQPVVLITVGRIASFSLEVTKVDGGFIDVFEFEDVEPGIYRFMFGEAVWPSDSAVVTLVYGVSMAGRKPIETAALNGLK